MKRIFLIWCKANPMLVNPSFNQRDSNLFRLLSCFRMVTVSIFSRYGMAMSTRGVPDLKGRTPFSLMLSVDVKVCPDFKDTLPILQSNFHPAPRYKKDIVA